MKRINLYFDFEFTSLSHDAQAISVGVVSEDVFLEHYAYGDQRNELLQHSLYNPKSVGKSFYAEFSDFDLNRCDDWVKENVVGKLLFNEKKVHTQLKDNTLEIKNITSEIISAIKGWLEQFQDYEIQFVCDCGTFDWYHLLQLIGEWEEIPTYISVDVNSIPIDMTLEDVCKMYKESPVVLFHQNIPSIPIYNGGKTGLPKLPENISPVPFDLNDLIAIKKGISPKEAFDLDRELMGLGFTDSEVEESMDKIGSISKKISDNKHNSIWDAKIIKAIYNKLA